MFWIVGSARDEISLRKWSGGSAHLCSFRGALVVENAPCWQQCFFFTHTCVHIVGYKPGVGKLIQWKSYLQKIKNTSEPQNRFSVNTSDVVETVTFETETWLKFRDETETSSKTPRLRSRLET